MPLGEFLNDTVVLDLSSVTRQPLEFAVSEHGPDRNNDPRSLVDAHGAVTNAWDWAIESGDALVDKEGLVVGFLTTYVFPVEDQVFLVGHSLGSTLDLITELMRSNEYGDRVCVLVQRHWPKTWRLLREGAGMPNEWGLLKIRTDQDYWFIGGFLRSRQLEVVDVDPSAVESFRGLAFDVLGDVLGFPGSLPGLLDILATDRRADQLRWAAGTFNTVAEILKNVHTILR
jgi:hypothetical protein